jgi:hypothetical protein
MGRGARSAAHRAARTPKTRAWILASTVVLAPAAAMGQAPTATSTSAPSAPSAPAADTATAPSGPASATPPKPVVPATGYGWSTPKTAPARARAPRASAHKNTPDALLPGFEVQPDGSTRFFVQLTQAVPFETKKARGSITYVLKGAHVGRRNNTNPLLTGHFNTPVTSARLVPHGNDLWFVLELRADVAPTATMDTPAQGPVTLRIDFPKGDYVPASAAPANAADETAPAGSSPTPSPAPPASSKPSPTSPNGL